MINLGSCEHCHRNSKLTNCSEGRIQLKQNLCSFVPSTIEITDFKRGNIFLHGDFEFFNINNQ